MSKSWAHTKLSKERKVINSLISLMTINEKNNNNELLENQSQNYTS